MAFNNSVSLFRRHDAAQLMMLRATMPQSGVVEYVDLIPRVQLTGRRWTAGNLTVLPKPAHLAVKAVR